MTVSIKQGVALSGLQPEMCAGLTVVASVYAGKGVPLTLTSGTDGEHMKGSLHYAGLALDLRLPSRYTGHIQNDKEIVAELKAALGAEFDVVLEGDHIHVEYDPK